MIISTKKKYVFIAVPKTGSTAIEECLQRADEGVIRNHVPASKGALIKVGTHASVQEVKDILGKQSSDYLFIGFLRDPSELVLSKYHFYRSGRAAKEHGLTRFRREQVVKFNIGVMFRVLAAQLLPFKLWVRLYPYKSTAHFVTDNTGDLDLDYVGSFSDLERDFCEIFSKFGYSPDQLRLGVTNKTTYDRRSAKSSNLKKVLNRRIPRDVAIYERAIGPR